MVDKAKAQVAIINSVLTLKGNCQTTTENGMQIAEFNGYDTRGVMGDTYYKPYDPEDEDTIRHIHGQAWVVNDMYPDGKWLWIYVTGANKIDMVENFVDGRYDGKSFIQDLSWPYMDLQQVREYIAHSDWRYPPNENL